MFAKITANRTMSQRRTRSAVLSLALSVLMIVSVIPFEFAYAATESVSEGTSTSTVSSAQLNGTPSSDSSSLESVSNQVIVRYKDGSVTTEKPTATEKRAAKNANVASTFGETMSASSAAEGKKAENTVGQQAEILEESLSDNYEIQDTVTFDATSKKEDETVVSVVSSDKYSTDKLVEKLEENSDVELVEPNYIVQALSDDETTESSESSWNDEYLNSAWQLNTINASDGWNAYSKSDTKSEDDVVAVVLDTGVDYTHEDIKDNMWTKPDNFSIQESGEHGINLVEGDDTTTENLQDPMDKNGHGTHCAGIIAAQANNGTGSAGVVGSTGSESTPKVKVLAIRVLNENGSGLTSWILKGFYYVNQYKKAGVNIKVVNCSLGSSEDTSIYDSVIDDLGKAGVLVAVAAGNSHDDNDSVSMAPANTASDYAITVASADEDGSLSSYSCYGKRNVDILAPGSNILSTVSSYSYLPWRYTASKLRSTTSYYNEFDENTTISGNTITGSSGSDPDGTSISGVNQFQSGKLVTKLTSGSNAKTTLSLNTSDSAKLTAAQQTSTLQLKITNAKKGDQFVLYFPYDKSDKETEDNTYGSVLHNITCEGSMQGKYVYGDIGVKLASTESSDSTESSENDESTASDSDAEVDASTTESSEAESNQADSKEAASSQTESNATASTDSKSVTTTKETASAESSDSQSTTFESIQVSDAYGNDNDDNWRTTSALYKSIWRGSQISDGMMTKSEENKSGYEYGLGIVFTAKASGNVTINLGSIGVSKSVTGTDSSDTLKDTSSFGKYDLYSGTSMATPVVAGSIALIAAMNPDADAKQLKALLYQATSEDTSEADKVSTSGEVDFSQYSSSETTEMSKPAIAEASVDASADTVTLEGTGLQGDSLSLTAMNRTTKKTQTISSDDMTTSSDGSTLTIQNASSYDLIGRDITFTIKNGEKSGTGSFYLVKGESTYTQEYRLSSDAVDEDSDSASASKSDKENSSKSKTMVIVDGDGDAEYSVDTNEIKWISNDRKILGQDSASGEIYSVDKDGLHHIGPVSTIEDIVLQYAEKQAESKDKSVASKWALGEDENYYVSAVSNATYYNGMVYELIGCDVGEARTAYVLVGMSVTSSSPSWKIYSYTMGDYANLTYEQETKIGTTLGNIDGKLYAIGGVDFLKSVVKTDENDDATDGTIYGTKTVYSCTPSSGATWKQEAELPFAAYGGTALQFKNKLYYVLGRKGTDTDRDINYDILEFDGSKWSTVGTLPSIVNTSADTIGWGDEIISAAVGIDNQGIVFGGASTDGYGDTYRFNVQNQKIEPIYYTAWGTAQTHKATGLSVGSKFYMLKIDESINPEDEEEYDYILNVSSMKIDSPYVTIGYKKSGKGSGNVYGTGTFLNGGKATITITPNSGSYIYSYSVSGYGISKSYAKPTSTSKSSQKVTLTLTKGATVNVSFGKTCTKVTINKKSLKLKRKKKYKLKATTNGTNTKVSWKVSNKKYASVTSSGKVTIKKKAKKGKTVTVTATSKENSKLKAKCKIKIK